MNDAIARMYGLIYGNFTTMIAYVYAELDIAGLLDGQPLTVEQLAERTGTDREALGRLLRAAAVLRFHEIDPDSGRLVLTRFGELLRQDDPRSVRSIARLNGAEYRYMPWGRLLDYLRTGTGRDISPTWGRATSEYLASEPELLEVFEDAMTQLGRSTPTGIDENRSIVEALDLSGHRRLIDIGGGHGTLLMALLEANPTLTGALFDLPIVLARLEVPDGLAGRLEIVPGDYMSAVPGGYDGYLMKNVIHNLPEADHLEMLRNIRRAMVEDHPDQVALPDRRLFLCEMILSADGRSSPSAALTDLNLNLLVGGVERSAADFDALLGRAGLEIVTILDLGALDRKIIETRVARRDGTGDGPRSQGVYRSS